MGPLATDALREDLRAIFREAQAQIDRLHQVESIERGETHTAGGDIFKRYQSLHEAVVDAAVALLESYRTANAARLTPEQTRELNFHVAQSLAMSGRDQESIPHFEQARGGDEEWSAYVEATIAFLNRDAAALTAQRARYAQAPNASEMRLTFIDGFLACTEQPYACRPLRHGALAPWRHAAFTGGAARRAFRNVSRLAAASSQSTTNA